MFRKLMLTTAIVSLAAGGAFAQTQPAPVQPAPMQDAAPAQQPPTVKAWNEGAGHLATNLIGENVYNGVAEDAQDLGKVTDLVIAPDGKVSQIVVGVGGFLGLGAKDVALDLAEAQVAERNGDRWLVVNTTKEALEAAPAFDRTSFDVPTETGSTTPVEPAPSTTTPPAAPTEAAPVAPAPAQ